MDLYKEFEKRDRPRSVVEKTELAKITRKSETQSFPLKSTCKKAPGEYFPTLNDTIKLLKFLETHETMPEYDRDYITQQLSHIDAYERKGLFIGMTNAFVLFFFPAIRRLPLYYRIPIASLSCYLWCNWGYNYGRDLVLVKTRNVIQNWERDYGLRHWQTGL